MDVRKQTQEKGTRERVRVVSIFFSFICAWCWRVHYASIYVCVWIKQTNQRTSSTSIVCVYVFLDYLHIFHCLVSFLLLNVHIHFIEVHVACRTSIEYSIKFSFLLLFTYSHYLTVKQPTTSSTYKSRALIVIFRVHTVCVMSVYNRSTALKKKKKRKNDSTHTH
jgi:hypothetical protein